MKMLSIVAVVVLFSLFAHDPVAAEPQTCGEAHAALYASWYPDLVGHQKAADYMVDKPWLWVWPWVSADWQYQAVVLSQQRIATIDWLYYYQEAKYVPWLLEHLGVNRAQHQQRVDELVAGGTPAWGGDSVQLHADAVARYDRNIGLVHLMLQTCPH